MLTEAEYDFIELIKNKELNIIEWLASQDEDSIRQRVYARVPEELDISVGSYIYDAIEPTNTEFAILYFMLKHVILLAFPQYSFGEWLTLSAASNGVYRKEATYASGKLKVSGISGTRIPLGSKFTNTIPNGVEMTIKYYTTQEECSIGEDGFVEVLVVADKLGAIGNASIGEINLNISDIPNLTTISNTIAFTNGAEEESDESLLERLLDKVRNPTSSGNKNDYKQWAKEIAGVAEVEVVPLWNGPGTVQVIIVGEGGVPIPDLVEKVKEHLDPTDHEGEGEGRAPIGAVVSVITTESYVIRIDVNGLEFEVNYDLENTKQELIKAIMEEVEKVKIGGLIRIHYIEDAVRHVKGIKDFAEVLINGIAGNIQTPTHLKPFVERVYFNES